MSTLNLTTKNNYREMLAAEFLRRQSKNSGYSLRAFAKNVGVSVATLSQVLNGKRTLSRISTQRIADRLFTDLNQRRKFLLSALGVQSDDECEPSANSIKIPGLPTKYSEIEVDQFKMIAEWYHFAILSLAKIQPNYSSPEWVSQRLGIQKRQAKAAMNRLLRLGFIIREGDGFAPGREPLFVNPTTSSAAVRQYHAENLQNARRALEELPRDLRHLSSMTMATSPKKLAEAAVLIQKFREEMSEFMEEGDGECTDVYTLAIQLFPVTVMEVVK